MGWRRERCGGGWGLSDFVGLVMEGVAYWVVLGKGTFVVDTIDRCRQTVCG